MDRDSVQNKIQKVCTDSVQKIFWFIETVEPEFYLQIFYKDEEQNLYRIFEIFKLSRIYSGQKKIWWKFWAEKNWLEQFLYRIKSVQNKFCTEKFMHII